MEFDQIRAHVLSRDPFPSLEQAYAMVQTVDSRRTAMLQSPLPDCSALFTGTSSSTIGNSFRHGSDKQPIKWEFCVKKCHTKEYCWKLHGRPTNGKGPGRGRGNNST